MYSANPDCQTRGWEIRKGPDRAGPSILCSIPAPVGSGGTRSVASVFRHKRLIRATAGAIHELPLHREATLPDDHHPPCHRLVPCRQKRVEPAIHQPHPVSFLPVKRGPGGVRSGASLLPENRRGDACVAPTLGPRSYVPRYFFFAPVFTRFWYFVCSRWCDFSPSGFLRNFS